MGGGTTKHALQCQISGSFRLIGQLQLAARAAGVDPENVDITVTPKTFDCEPSDFRIFCLLFTSTVS